MCLSNVEYFLPSLRGLTEVRHHSYVDTVIIEVSSVKALSLRGNLQRLYRAKSFAITKWDLYSGQTIASYINMKVLTFAKDESMIFLTTANLSYDQKLLTL